MQFLWMHLSNTSFAELTSLSKHQPHPNNYTEKFICARSIFANYLLAAESFPFFLFLSELHTRFVAHKNVYAEKKFKHQLALHTLEESCSLLS